MTMMAWPSASTLLEAGLGCLPLAAVLLLSRASASDHDVRSGSAGGGGSARAAPGIAAPLLAGCGFVVALLLQRRPPLQPALMLATILCLLAAGSRTIRRRASRHAATGIDPVRAATTLARVAGLAGDAAQLRIGRIVHVLALRAGLDRRSADELQAATMLYRIGRIGMPERILRQAHPLDAADLQLLRRDPEIGARILGGSRITLLDCAAELALCHQERWDGSGYPRGLLGAQIPISARIVSLVATVDALLAGGTGRPPWQPEQVVAHIAAAAGRLFDPELTELFIDEMPVMLALWDQPS